MLNSWNTQYTHYICSLVLEDTVLEDVHLDHICCGRDKYASIQAAFYLIYCLLKVVRICSTLPFFFSRNGYTSGQIRSFKSFIHWYDMLLILLDIKTAQFYPNEWQTMGPYDIGP